VNERRQQLVELASDLVRIDARNPWLIDGGAGEQAIAADLAARARAIHGAEVSVVNIRPGRPNVLVRLPGSGGGASLCLNAHIDTVGDASWPGRSMVPVVDGDHLIGLGAADDKGHCAAVLLAIADLAKRPAPLRGDVVAAFVMDEEATSLGTEALVRDHSYDGAIVVEPFGLGRAIVTHQGFGWLDITVHGRAAHGSAPDLGIDAISRLALVSRRLDDLGRSWAADPHPLNGATVYHASTISGGSDYATYPARATLGIEIGTQPGETIAARLADIETIFADLRRELPDFEAEVAVRLARDPFEAVGHERLFGALDEASRLVTGSVLDPAGENAWMDAALVQAAGIPTVSIGASGGNLHAPDEWVSIPELVNIVTILEQAVVHFCGETEPARIP
jgi:acetylornithine deacetylase/succinyl-diaminopimelate desuccinylase-like protein